jgi:hypothetical protein
MFIVSALYDRIFLANLHALHHKSRDAIFMNVQYVQATSKELLNNFRNYSDELTKVTRVGRYA